MHYLASLAAAIELVVVGGKNALCTGASVTLQCTLTGHVLTWNTPEGALNFVRGGKSEINEIYQGNLEELNDTHIRSTLAFNCSAEITINCTDQMDQRSTTIIIEGVAFTFLYPLSLIIG